MCGSCVSLVKVKSRGRVGIRSNIASEPIVFSKVICCMDVNISIRTGNIISSFIWLLLLLHTSINRCTNCINFVYPCRMNMGVIESIKMADVVDDDIDTRSLTAPTIVSSRSKSKSSGD